MNIKLFIIIPLIVASVSMVGCKKTKEAQLASIEAKKALQIARIKAEERIQQRKIEAEQERVREQAAHDQEMKELSNTFWTGFSVVFVIGGIILIFRVLATYIERESLIKDVREFEIEKELEASIEKYKIAIQEVKNLLPLLSPEERKSLFENGGLLAKDEILRIENS